MNKRPITKPTFRLLRMFMLLFMIFGVFGPMGQSASAAQAPGLSVELCWTLDTDAPFLVLSDAELSVLAGEPYNYSEAQISAVASFCEDQPSIDLGGGNNGGLKVFVCKYVGTPNVDERLQTGNNPISVSVNAIPNYQGVGSYFADAQGRSYVLAVDTTTGGGQTGEPSVDDCPPPDGPDPGLGLVVKYFCADTDITVPVVGGEYEDCEPATAGQLAGVNFLVYPFGHATAAIDVDDSLLLGAGVELPVGTHTLVEVLNGVTYELGDLVIVAGQTTTIVVNNPIPEESGAGLVVKYFCADTDITVPVVDGEYEDCSLATAEQLAGINFLVYPFGDAAAAIDVDDALLLTTGVELPAGTHTLVEVADGVVYELGDLVIVAGETTTITVYNPIPELPGVGVVVKQFCADDDITVPVVGGETDYDDCEPATAEKLEGVNFLVYPFGVEADAIDVDDALLLTTGVELPVGTHTLVEVVDGVTYVLGDLVITSDGTTVIYVFNPAEQPGFGRINVVKYFCEDADITVPVVGDDDSDYDDCVPATVELLEGVNFVVYPFGVEADAIDIDDTALLSTGVELPVGTHTLVEVVDGVVHELATVTVTDGSTVSYMVFNPVEKQEITLNLYKFVCSGFSEKQEDGCVESGELDGVEIGFTVTYMIGDEETTVETSVVIEGSEGSAMLTLPNPRSLHHLRTGAGRRRECPVRGRWHRRRRSR